jgi:hypothetical protein
LFGLVGYWAFWNKSTPFCLIQLLYNNIKIVWLKCNLFESDDSDIPVITEVIRNRHMNVNAAFVNKRWEFTCCEVVNTSWIHSRANDQQAA